MCSSDLSALLVGFGLFISRRVKKADDFLVAGRSLGPGLLATAFLAANIGAGSTVGATGVGYVYGFGGWWGGGCGGGAGAGEKADQVKRGTRKRKKIVRRG